MKVVKLTIQPCNLAAWIRWVVGQGSKQDMSRNFMIFRDRVAFNIPPRTETEIQEMLGMAVTPTVLSKFAVDQRLRDLIEMTEVKKKNSAAITLMTESMSSDTLTRLQGLTGWYQAVEDQSIQRVYDMIMSLHGATAMSERSDSAVEKASANRQVVNARQRPNEAVGEYKQRFDELRETSIIMGNEPLDEETSATIFFLGLDHTRHGDMILGLQNDDRLPDTLAKAYFLASTWKSRVPTKNGGDVFIGALSDTVRSRPAVPTKTATRNAKPPRPTPTSAGPPRSCYNCGRQGHVSRGCPEPRDEAAFAKNREADHRKKTPAAILATTSSDVDEGPDEAMFIGMNCEEAYDSPLTTSASLPAPDSPPDSQSSAACLPPVVVVPSHVDEPSRAGLEVGGGESLLDDPCKLHQTRETVQPSTQGDGSDPCDLPPVCPLPVGLGQEWNTGGRTVKTALAPTGGEDPAGARGSDGGETAMVVGVDPTWVLRGTPSSPRSCSVHDAAGSKPDAGAPRRSPHREARFKGSLDENPEWVELYGAGYMGYGVRAARKIPAGTQVALYSGRMIRSEWAYDEWTRWNPADKILKARGGKDPLWIDAATSDELGGMINHGCGRTVNCPAQTVLVIDDQNRDKVSVVTTRPVLAGEQLLLDYCIDHNALWRHRDTDLYDSHTFMIDYACDGSVRGVDADFDDDWAHLRVQPATNPPAQTANAQPDVPSDEMDVVLCVNVSDRDCPSLADGSNSGVSAESPSVPGLDDTSSSEDSEEEDAYRRAALAEFDELDEIGGQLRLIRVHGRLVAAGDSQQKALVIGSVDSGTRDPPDEPRPTVYNTLAFDSGAAASVISHEKLVEGVRPMQTADGTDTSKLLTGVGGATIRARFVADLYGMKVLYVPEANVNVLSGAQVRDQGWRVTYNSDDDVYAVNPDGTDDPDTQLTFARRPGGKHYLLENATVLVTTVREQLNARTSSQVARANTARHLHECLGGSVEAAAATLSTCRNNPVTAHDLRTAEHIYGKSREHATGSSVQRKASAITTELTNAPRDPQRMEVDIMFTGPVMTLVGRLIPMGFVMAVVLPNKTRAMLAKALLGFTARLKARRIPLVDISSDNEKGVHTEDIATRLAEKSTTLTAVAPGEHCHTIERTIRDLKDEIRGRIFTWPFLLTKFWWEHVVLAVVSAHNLRATAHGASPASAYYNRVINVTTDIKFKAGQLVDAVFPATTNGMGPRSERAVALYPTLTAGGGYVCVLLGSRTVVTRKSVSLQSVPWPTETLHELNDEAGEDNCTQRSGVAVDMYNRRGDGPAIGGGEPAAGGEENDTPVPVGEDGIPIYWGPPEPAVVMFNGAEAGTTAPSETVRKISVKAAMREMPEKAIPAIKKELGQMLTRKVFVPVRWANLTIAERAAVLRSSMFCKDKVSADGTVGTFKARLVAGGDGQDKSAFEEAGLYSPTVATTSLLIVAAIAAHEGRHVMTLDVGGAFLNADMPSDGIKVHMRINGVLAALLVELDPAYEPFVDNGGCVVVELTKALYGTVQASKLWYELLTKELLGLGFVQNPYDKCVFNKTVEGHQVSLALHVDDMLVTSVDVKDLNALAASIMSKWSNSTRHDGPVVDFVGMTMDYATRRDDRLVEVTMDGITNTIIVENGVARAKRSPAALDLFEVDPKSPALNVEGAKRVKSGVPKLSWVGKRARPEILAATSFLTTRTSAPTEQDQAKLTHVHRYLYGSRHRGIALGVADEGMRVEAHIDAAYGVHGESGKSHSGLSISLGKGPVHVASKKQKIVTKSSTEAELVALSDMASQVIHVRNFVIAQGYAVGPAVIYQDNLSCMALMNKGGPCSERTRHIAIREFWLKERIDNGDVKTVHKGTAEMYANVVTKAVVGEQFEVERKGLTNW